MAISLHPALFFLISLLSIVISITGFTHAYNHQCLDDQKTLLLDLKDELMYDSSSSPRKLERWNDTEDCCSWAGVECDEAGHVISLQLDWEGVYGGIENSSSLFNIRYLKKLNLANNDFNGIQIPRGIGNLTYLTHLNLSDAGFGGQVPIELSHLSRLVSLDLSGNWYIEPLNEQLNLTTLLQNLTRLQQLYLDYIDISIQGSEWCQVISSSSPHLRSLSLCDCNLSGPLDPSFRQLHSLSLLRLDGNNLSTTLPDFFADFSSLTTLSLRDCSLKGSFPEMIFQVPTLQELDLSYNELLSGTIPQFPRSGAFRSIKISHCNFSGPIPPTLANSTQLVYLDFSYNFFTGLIPPFYMSKKLTNLDLSFNHLNGSLSFVTFGSLSNLVSIDLSYNSLSGSIPQSLFGLPSLEELILNNNQFSGTFQLEKIQSRTLFSLDLSYNNLSVDASSSTNSSFSTFPKLGWLFLSSCSLHSFPDLRNQSNLNYLDLSNNRIRGEIPNWIWEIGDGQLLQLNLSCNLLVDLQKPYRIPSALLLLDLHSNLLQGELPLTSLTLPSHLFFFNVANNRLSGAIPYSLCNSSILEVVDLSLNDFSGSIPPCLLENKELRVLNLAKNNVNGNIPDAFPVDCSLETLDLSNNNLGGNIPKSLANCKSLVAMNVGKNNINDSFPCKLPSSLRLLVLHSNRFHGELRCHNSSWPNLQIIDIASNNFSGSLHPITFISSWGGMMSDSHAQLMRYCEGLGYVYKLSSYKDEVTLTIKGLELALVNIWGDFASIDFSCNNFQGTIPDAIGDLGSLDYLNLSHNFLTGAIPKSFGKLRQLGSLDLSVNQLTGGIPMELAGLTFLSVLNLSHNKLVGMIPIGPQIQTFSADSFQGNTGLCGRPLTISCNNNSSPPKLENVQQSHGKMEIEWDYVSAALGYVVGLGSFVWLLLCCQSLRRRYFEKVDEVLDKIFDRGGRRRVQRRNQVRRQ